MRWCIAAIGVLRKAVAVLRQWLCGMRRFHKGYPDGHDNILRMEGGRFYLACASCGWKSKREFS